MAKSVSAFPNVDFSKFAAQLKMPSVDAGQVAASYRKNVEAITSASQVAIAGMQAVSQRQAEILSESMEEYMRLLREFSTPTSAKEAASMQAEFAKHAFETMLSHMREISEMITKTNDESLEVINKRVTEMLREFKALAGKKKSEAT